MQEDMVILKLHCSTTDSLILIKLRFSTNIYICYGPYALVLTCFATPYHTYIPLYFTVKQLRTFLYGKSLSMVRGGGKCRKNICFFLKCPTSHVLLQMGVAWYMNITTPVIFGLGPLSIPLDACVFLTPDNLEEFTLSKSNLEKVQSSYKNAENAYEVVATESPDCPVFLFRPHRLAHAAKWFSLHFPGEVYYAVKANPSVNVIKELWNGGVRGFDVASLQEVKLVSHLCPTARLAFMHPIKNRSVISEAYFQYGVRRFVLDSMSELDKIMAATRNATDLTLVVRFMVANYGSSIPLTGKFGATPQESAALLRATRRVAAKMGISFHVGSQALKPHAYDMALSLVAAQIEAAGADISVDIVDVGGGFPSVYDMEAPPPLAVYVEGIIASIKRLPVFANALLWCEPGRGLSAEAESLLTRIEGVKVQGDMRALYLNDGSYGALYDVVHEQWKYPVRAISAAGTALPVPNEADNDANLVPYMVYGPTCDSADKFPDPVLLPRDLAEGDYLEWGNIGAYGRAMATAFNGFGSDTYETISVRDEPWQSLFLLNEVVAVNMDRDNVLEVQMESPFKTSSQCDSFERQSLFEATVMDMSTIRPFSPAWSFSPVVSDGGSMEIEVS